MTNLGEAKCAREAEISYATMAMVTDYDCWNEEHDHVTVEMVMDCLHRNAATAKRLLLEAIPRIPAEPNFKSHRALKNAIMTDRKLWPKRTVRELRPLLAQYL
jgi:5'-methylthioadenosine phosphorylase